jgi:mannose-6-phosphate isomerase class I
MTELTHFQKKIREIEEQRKLMMNASTPYELLNKFRKIQNMYKSFKPTSPLQNQVITRMKKQDINAHFKTMNRIEKPKTYFDRMVAYAADTPIGAATRKRVGAARNQVVGAARKTVDAARNRAVAGAKVVGGMRNRAVAGAKVVVAAAHETKDLVRNTVEAGKQNMKVIGGAYQDIKRALHAWQRLKNRAIYVPNYLRGMVSHFTANGTRNVKERAGFKKALLHRDMILSRIGGRRAR